MPFGLKLNGIFDAYTILIYEIVQRTMRKS